MYTDVIIVVIQSCFGITGQILGRWDAVAQPVAPFEDYVSLYFELDYLRHSFEVRFCLLD